MSEKKDDLGSAIEKQHDAKALKLAMETGVKEERIEVLRKDLT